jgi:hypothetical protein
MPSLVGWGGQQGCQGAVWMAYLRSWLATAPSSDGCFSGGMSGVQGQG